MSERAIIVVDLQNEYLPTGKLPLTGIDQAVAHAVAVIENARARGELVVNVRHESADPASPIFTAGTDATQFMSAVQPQPGEPEILKQHPNSFIQTDLQKILEAHGIQKVTIVGAMSHMCIDATARAAADLGYQVTVVHDACATRDLEFGGVVVAAAQVHVAFMSALAFAYGRIISCQEYLANK